MQSWVLKVTYLGVAAAATNAPAAPPLVSSLASVVSSDLLLATSLEAKLEMSTVRCIDYYA